MILSGTIASTVQLQMLNNKWMQKKESGNVLSKQELNERSTWTSEQFMVADFQDQLEHNREAEKRQKIDNKIMSGGSLSPEEISYLEKNDPAALKKYHETKEEKEAYKEKLRQCKTKEEVDRVKLQKLGELAVKYDFYIIADEVYEKLIYGEAEHISIASLSEEIKNKTVLINGFSKSYAMTGWRIGYVAANEEVIAAVKGIQSHTTSSGNSITQYAATEAYRGSQESVERMRKAFLERREYLVKRINEMPYVSCNSAPGAFYLMLNISRVKGMKYEGTLIDSSKTLAELLLTEAHIAMVAGEAFHADDYMRICYAASMEDLREGMNRLEAFLKKVSA